MLRKIVKIKKKAKKKRVLFIDEAWMLLPIPRSCRLFKHNGKTCKKKNVSLAIMSQRFQDFYEKPEVQAVLTSSDTKTIFSTR